MQPPLYLVTVSVWIRDLPFGWDDSAGEPDCYAWVSPFAPADIAACVELWVYNKLAEAGHIVATDPEYAFAKLDMLVECNPVHPGMDIVHIN